MFVGACQYNNTRNIFSVACITDGIHMHMWVQVHVHVYTCMCSSTTKAILSFSVLYNVCVA